MKNMFVKAKKNLSTTIPIGGTIFTVIVGGSLLFLIPTRWDVILLGSIVSVTLFIGVGFIFLIKESF